MADGHGRLNGRTDGGIPEDNGNEGRAGEQDTLATTGATRATEVGVANSTKLIANATVFTNRGCGRVF